MVRADAARIAQLEESAFSTPWSEATFANLVDDPNVIMRVCEVEGAPVGYVVVWCAMEEAELANLAVAPEYRRRGIGRSLLLHALEEARARGVRQLYLEVRESNHEARDLYRSEGFGFVRLRHGYYDNPKEDALVLVRSLMPDTLEHL